MEFEEIGFGNRDGFCPYCGGFYREDKLDELLLIEEYTEFEWLNCNKWIRGFAEFAFTGDIEYHLVAVKPVTE